MAFKTGYLEMEHTWLTIFFLTKVRGEYWITGLMELIWKMISIIVYLFGVNAIKFHNILHVFWSKIGTETATCTLK